MSQAPMMPVYPDALLGDTLHLSAEQFGAYLLLLFATWRNNGKPLPDDDRKLARICRCTVARWRRMLRPTVLEFFTTDDGFLHQKRLESEWNFVQKKRSINANFGALGGSAKALKSHNTTPSERYAVGSPKNVAHPEPEPEPEPRRSQEEALRLKNLKGDLGCASREPEVFSPLAEDVAAVDAIVAGVRDVLALPATGLRNGTYNADAYRQAIRAAKRDQWLNNLATWASEALPGLPEKMAAWQAIEAARNAGSRDATPPDVRRAVDALSRLRDTSVAYAEAAE